MVKTTLVFAFFFPSKFVYVYTNTRPRLLNFKSPQGAKKFHFQYIYEKLLFLHIRHPRRQLIN